MHIKEAKRETRSIDTWKKQFEAISLGLAFCVTARLDQELVFAAYFYVQIKFAIMDLLHLEEIYLINL